MEIWNWNIWLNYKETDNEYSNLLDTTNLELVTWWDWKNSSLKFKIEREISEDNNWDETGDNDTIIGLNLVIEL